MFEHLIYAAALLFVLSCLMLVDYRWRLAAFESPTRTRRVLLGGLLLFILWDIAGIAARIFYIGNSGLLSGIRLGTNFPFEEILFLAVLLYTTLLVWRGVERAT